MSLPLPADVRLAAGSYLIQPPIQVIDVVVLRLEQQGVDVVITQPLPSGEAFFDLLDLGSDHLDQRIINIRRMHVPLPVLN